MTTEELIASQWVSLYGAIDRWWSSSPRDASFNVLRARLGRFVKWCAQNGPVPEFTSDRTIDEFVAVMKAQWAPKYHYLLEKRLRVAWNFAAFVVPGWPAVWVSAPSPRRELPIRDGDDILSFAEHQFHPSLVSEVKRYCANGGFLPEGVPEPTKSSHRDRLQSRLAWLQTLPAERVAFAYPARPLRQLALATLHTQTRLIYKTATALHTSGEADVQDLRRIVDVVTSRGAAVLADVMEARRGPRGAVAAAKYVAYFNSIARRCGVILSPAEREVVNELRRDLHGVGGPVSDISEMNYRRLAKFDDRGKFAMLVALPDTMMQEVERARRGRGFATEEEARQARCAIAIEILNTLPLRRRTLAELDLERNFLKARGAAAKLVTHRDQEKSGRILETVLSARTWRLISLYRKHYRPLLRWASRSTSLFPGLRGHISSQPLGTAITEVVGQRIGVHANVHLWRHIMGTKLTERTGRPEDGERLLGHTPGSSATKRYIRLRSNEAAAALGRVTDEVRDHGMQLLGRRRLRGQPVQGSKARRQGA